MVFAEMVIANMEDNGREEEAKKLEKQIDTVIKLIDDGKKQEAQKAYEGLRETMRASFRGFGRGRGGFGGRGGDRGGRGGDRGGRRGGRSLSLPEGLEAPLAQMDEDTRKKKVDFLIEWAGNQTKSMRGEQAEKLTGQITEFKKMVEQKNWAGADKLVNTVMQEISGGGEGRRGRRGGEGGQGGEGRRRRRGGDEGEGGEGRRRRRGGDEGGTGRIK